MSNFTPVVRYDYCLGVPKQGEYIEVLNSDGSDYGGSGQLNANLVATSVSWHNQPYSIKLKVPPLATTYLKLKKGFN